MKIITMSPARIGIREEDMPPIVGVPPNRKDNDAFNLLCQTIKREGVLTPIFVDKYNCCVEGHYRLWAALFTKRELVPVVIIEDEKDVERYFEELCK